jgi:hypothetical protein
VLGIVERQTDDPGMIQKTLPNVPTIGHPFSKPELVSAMTPLPDLISALTDRRLLVEGETTIELSEEGRIVRTTVRFKPREGLVTKIINRMSVSFSLKDLFGGG